MNKAIGLITILLTLICSHDVKGQPELHKEIIGHWKASKIYDLGAIIPDASKQKIETMQKLLLNSEFKFTNNYNFSFKCSMEEMTIKNGHWKIDKETGAIIIKDWNDRDEDAATFMKIIVLRKDDKIIFMIEEVFFAFEMTKLN